MIIIDFSIIESKLSFPSTVIRAPVLRSDKYGDWGTEDYQWCGILKKTCENKARAFRCYGEFIGEYKCCESCDVVLVDRKGEWGRENHEWCSIKYSCLKVIYS